MKNKALKIALLVLGVLILVMFLAQRAGWVGSDEGHRVSVEEAEFRDIVEIVTANGRVRPVTEVKMAPDVSGEIIELNVKEGDYVERGQLLARINPDIYEAALDRMVAALNTSKANLASARARALQAEAQYINQKANYERNKRLFEQNAISESEYDTARSQYLIAQADVEASKQSIIASEFQVKSAEAGVTESRDNLSKTNLFAPMNGTVSRLDAEIGERVVGTSQFAGTEIIRIANLNMMEVKVDVNENDIVRVNEGDTAFIQVDAFFVENFKGVVTSIANSAAQEALGADQVTNFEVRIRILPDSYAHLQREDRPHLSPFRPGMSATVDIQTQSAYNTVSVPIQAVTTRREETRRGAGREGGDSNEDTSSARPKEYVFLYDNGLAKQVEVRSGIQDNQYIQIIEGLEEGQEVITGPYRLVSRELRDGDQVVKVQRQDLFR
ncbi:MAG: HlyD family efflux transporter periplasmic adaptor subunit [Bacteroidia bacterium]|nr:MAG: HlyD family efflux transporter periplasmic adaptor subunit [Bacteroidia bacterium]